MALSCSKNFFCRITSKHDGDFYCLNYLHLFRTENKLKEHENVCENHDYCCIEMPKKGRNILKYHHGEKAMKVSFIIYVDTESLLEKTDTWYSNLQKSTTLCIRYLKKQARLLQR